MHKNNYTAVKQINNYLEISTRYHYKGPVSSNHWHDYFEFEMVLDGIYEHTAMGKKRIAKRGSAWIMSRLNYHSLSCFEDAILINISFTGENINKDIMEILSSSAGGIHCEFDEQTTSKILEMCERARCEMMQKPALWKCSVTGSIENIIITAIRNAEHTPESTGLPAPKLLQSVTSYLRKNYKSNLSLCEVAKKFDISSGHLGLIFSKTFGMSYNSYVARIRLRHACNMLTHSKLSTKEIANECGFNSNEYFFYTFKKHLEMTPNEYRKTTSEKQ